MGNCCCPQSDDENQALTGDRRPTAAFQGEGRRLGTANETNPNQATYQQQSPSGGKMIHRDDENIPEPIIDQTLTEAERAKIREDRAKAAEERLKKNGGTTKNAKKKTSDSSNEPLRGPNSKNTMTWTVG